MEVLGRTGVLRGSSGCLNTGSCSFHLVAARETRVARWSGSVYPDVENNGMGRACRSIVHIACTRCTETIRMQNKEEMRVFVESDSDV